LRIPRSLVKGDSVSWVDLPTRDNFGNSVGSDAWTIVYSIRGPGGALDTTSTAYNSGWKTSLSTTDLNSLTAGDYFYQAYAIKSGERITIGSGPVKIEENLATVSAGFDARSQTQKDLDAVNQAIRSIAQGGMVAEYTIGNRQVRKMQLTDLLVLKAHLTLQLNRENAAEKVRNGLGNPFTVYTRFK
jgi:hypothetical protein